MGIISWIIFGLIAGILAKWIMPGKDGGGFIMTVVLGSWAPWSAAISAPSSVWVALTALTWAALWWR